MEIKEGENWDVFFRVFTVGKWIDACIHNKPLVGLPGIARVETKQNSS